MNSDVLIHQPKAVQARSGSRIPMLVMLGFFILLYLVTRPDTTGDTPVYVGDIFNYSRTGHAPLMFWDFGHLLWRPLGYALWRLTGPLTYWLYGGNPIIELTAILFALNLVSGLILTLLTFSIARRLELDNFPACCVTAGMLLCNAVLDYMHSGTSYLPGVTMQLLGCWLILEAMRNFVRWRLYAIGAGIALTLSFATWFPFCLSVPAAISLLLLDTPRDYDTARNYGTALGRVQRIRIAASIAGTVAVLALLLFAVGAAMAHATSLAGLKEWVANSGHGLHPDRRFLRFPTGVTRTFFFLGDEGVMIKRFLLRDPYAPVRWIDLVNGGLWKIGLVFLFFVVLFWTLLKSASGRRALIVTLAGVVPTLLFAIVLFETSQSERYFPFYAAVLVGVCGALKQRAHRQISHWAYGVFLILLALVNLQVYAYDLRTTAHESANRMRLVHEHTQHGGVALILSFQDPLSTYFQRSPFDPQNRPGALSLYHVIEHERGDVGDWKSLVACRVTRAWHEGGDAWISKRLVAPKPDPSWGWVEHDIRAVSWPDINNFFTQFNTDGDIGGAEGFLRLADSKANGEALKRTCAFAENGQ